MTVEQKIAIARIVSDMIKADNIIEESEIMDMKKIMMAYGLTQKHMSDARKIKFSEAVYNLRDLSARERKKFFDCIYNLALSDNICVPKEALLLLALQYCLIKDDIKDEAGHKLPQPYLISCPSGESSMSDQYMVYLESAYDEERNRDLESNFKVLVSESRLSGFNFIYIPKMVEEFKGMDRQYVLDVISYMAPNLEEQSVKNVYDRLCKITTAEFFHSVLEDKLQIRADHNAPPSILINIGSSVVPYCAAAGSVQYYTEFLCIPINSTTLSLVEEILNFYKSKVSLKMVILNDNQGQFKYFGFYKALFDFLAAPPPVAPDLIFLGQDARTSRYSILFRYDEHTEKKVHLTPVRYELYKTIVHNTYCSRKKGTPVSQVPRTERIEVSRLRGIFAQELADVAFVEQYKPERTDDNLYRIRLDKRKVFKREYDLDHAGQYRDIPVKDWQN